MRILVVDDDPLDIQLIRHWLVKAGYDIHVAFDGAAAFELLKTPDAFQMVISDWRMPKMTGPELCRAVREQRSGGYIYLILLTAYDGSEERVSAFSSGADDFVTKPFNPDELLGRVRAGERVITANRADLQSEISKRRLIERDLIRERQRLEQTNAELEHSNTKLTDLYQTAQRFVDNVSHEFRTPLTVIKGYAEVVAEAMAGPVNDRQKEFLSFIVDRARDLGQMVDDLLDTSKIRAGTLRVDRTPCTLYDILKPVRPILNAKAATAHVQLEEKVPGDLPKVVADMEKAGRVILNLAINAIKFSPEGGTVTLWARPEQGGGVEVGITDRGPGISPENLSVIFDRFKQLGQLQETTKGFGLGLNIARELASLNLGEIRVKSDVGNGSTFSFVLPPDNPEEILRRYLAFLQGIPNLEPSIAILRVEHGAEEPIAEAARKFLATNIRSVDLLLRNDDDHSLLIIGCTSDLDRWADKIQEEIGGFIARSNAPTPLDSIEVQPLGQWHYPLDKDQFWSRIMECLQQEVSHG
jgi:signal transduction histidine kinase